MAHAVNIWDSPEDTKSASPDSLSEDASKRENDDIQQDWSYHIGVMFMADEGEAFFRKCYNCEEPGHPWRECKKPLKPSLKLGLESRKMKGRAVLAEKKGLNQTGGAGVEGGSIPKATPAAAQKEKLARILPAATGMRMSRTGGLDRKILAKSWWMVNQLLPSSIMVPR